MTALTEKPAARPKASSVAQQTQDLVVLLRSDSPLVYAWRKRLADVFEEFARLEQAYLDARKHTGPPPRPRPGDAAYLALQIVAALTPDAPRKSAAPTPKKETK